MPAHIAERLESVRLFSCDVTANNIIENNHMRLQFVTIGQNLKWPRGRQSLARKKTRREFMTLVLARVIKNNRFSKIIAANLILLLVVSELAQGTFFLIAKFFCVISVTLSEWFFGIISPLFLASEWVSVLVQIYSTGPVNLHVYKIYTFFVEKKWMTYHPHFLE